MKLTKARIKRFKEWVMNPLPSMTSCVFYRCIMEDDKTMDTVRGNDVWHTACYAGLSSDYNWDGQPQFIINGLTSAFMKQDKEAAIAELDYLMNRSGFSNCFLEKDAKKAYKERCTVHDARLATNLVVGGLTAVRNIGEPSHSMHTRTFKYLVDNGCSEAWAYAVSWQVYSTAGSYSFSPIVSGHCVFDARTHTIGHTLCLMQGKPQQLNPLFTSKYRSYYGVNKLFFPTKLNPGMFGKWLGGNIKVGEVKVKAYDNPFGSYGGGKKYSTEDFGPAIAALEGKFIEEFGNA